MSDASTSNSWVVEVVLWCCGAIGSIFSILLGSLWLKHNEEIRAINLRVETNRIETANHIKAVYEKIDVTDMRAQDRHAQLLNLFGRLRP